jgi:hypothetical protein
MGPLGLCLWVNLLWPLMIASVLGPVLARRLRDSSDE